MTLLTLIFVYTAGFALMLLLLALAVAIVRGLPCFVRGHRFYGVLCRRCGAQTYDASWTLPALWQHVRQLLPTVRIEVKW